MLEPALMKRLPVLILLGVITVISLVDWMHGLRTWMMVPSDVTEAWEAVKSAESTSGVWKALLTTLTAAFLHGDGGHLIGNLLFLWIFGVVVFELCGWRWMLAVFFITAIGGSVGQILLDPESVVPVLGASGALMGLEGFYFGLATQKPRADSEVWPLARPVNSGELAAAGAVGLILDVVGVMGPGQGIAFGAHIGGFVTGMLLSLIAGRSIP
jgi:membrane associated rhomboid family serine protease